MWGKGETRGTTYGGTGYEYFAGAPTAGSFSAEVDTKSTLKGTAQGLSQITFDMKYNSSYESPAQQALIEGSWSTFDNSASFLIDGTGKLLGILVSADTGYQPCSFTGAVTAHDSKNYYELSLTTSADIGCQPYINYSFKGIVIGSFSGADDTLLIGAAGTDNRYALFTVATLN